MTTHEFLTNAGIIAAFMAATALIELFVPLFARGARSAGRARANLGLTALALLLNWAVASLAAVVALRLEIPGRGLLAQLALPLPALVAATVVTLDLCTYAAHRSMHALPFLWRAHSVHHSDPFLDVTSTVRQHPLEGLWRFAWILAPTWLLGLPAAGVVVYRLLSVLQGVLEHANVRVFAPLDRAVSLFWVTPNMHKVHHSRIRGETDSNYGNLFALFDRALGTFTPTERAFGVSYGLDDVDPRRARSLLALLALPFARPREIRWPDGARARGAANLGRSE
jgi:sterol desaturase/sphingolipid hydroxylase (fatty acid hydroxylase superfamily)